MSNMSVSRVRVLPQATRLWTGDNLSRKLLLRVLSNIRVGSFTIRDGGEVFRLGNAGVPGEPQAEVTVHDRRVYRKILTGGTIASGEAYIEGDWSTPDLTAVTRVFSANMQTLESMQNRQHWTVRAALKLAHLANRNTREGSKRNISAHYDLGNDFFRLFLDPTMMYSAALFEDPAATLERASEAKLDEICRQLELSPEFPLVEIGTGWGGMAIHLAGELGARVTSVTISQAQHDLARERIRDAGLSDGEILEVNQVAAYFAYANRTVTGLGVHTEGERLGLCPPDDEEDWHHG